MSNGPKNYCTHESGTGVDCAPSGDPDKLWRCDGCGLLHRWAEVGWNESTRKPVTVMVVVDPLRELAARVEEMQRGALDTLNASEGEAGYAAIEASAYGVAVAAAAGGGDVERAMRRLRSAVDGFGWDHDGVSAVLNGSGADHAEVLYQLLDDLGWRPDTGIAPRQAAVIEMLDNQADEVDWRES